MPVVDCGSPIEWAAYVEDNPALWGFGHLRPEGRVWLQEYSEPPPGHVLNILAGHPAELVQDVLDYIEETATDGVSEQVVPGGVLPADSRLEMRKLEAWRYSLTSAEPTEPFHRPIVYDFEATGTLYRHGNPDVPRTTDQKIAAIADLTSIFSTSVVRVFYFWSPVGREGDGRQALDAFYLSDDPRGFRATVLVAPEIVGLRPGDKSPKAAKLGAFLMDMIVAVYFAKDRDAARAHWEAQERERAEAAAARLDRLQEEAETDASFDDEPPGIVASDPNVQRALRKRAAAQAPEPSSPKRFRLNRIA